MKQMNQIFRKFACSLTAAALLIIQGIPVFAQDTLFPGGTPQQQTSGTTLDGKWTYYDKGNGTLSVICNDETLETVEIPETINDMPVTMIEADCFKDNNVMKSVSIPNTVTHIEDFAFYNCTALESISLPNGLLSIAWQAFYGCSSLTEVTIPASVETIEEFVFEGCTSMEAIQVSDANDYYKDLDGVLYDIAGTTLIYYPSAKQGTFYDIPDGCTTIEDWAFIGNPYLEEIDLSGVTTLGEEVFYHCTALKSVVLPEGIVNLHTGVFGNCTSLTDVQFPSTLESIGDSCFYSCTSLAEITLPESVTTLGHYAFLNCPALESIVLTDSVTFIGDYALGYYTNAEEMPERIPGFVIDTSNDTQAFAYALENDIKSTGGVTQSSVFIFIILAVLALVVICTIIVIIIQRRIQKRYELN